MSTPGHPDMAPVELPVTCQANPMQLPVGLKHHGLMREEGGRGGGGGEIEHFSWSDKGCH